MWVAGNGLMCLVDRGCLNNAVFQSGAANRHSRGVRVNCRSFNRTTPFPFPLACTHTSATPIDTTGCLRREDQLWRRWSKEPVLGVHDLLHLPTSDASSR